MHPILGHRSRLLYLGAWLPIGGLLAVLVALLGQVEWAAATVLAVPLALLYAFICLASWYPSRGTPLGRATAGAWCRLMPRRRSCRARSGSSRWLAGPPRSAACSPSPAPTAIVASWSCSSSRSGCCSTCWRPQVATSTSLSSFPTEAEKRALEARKSEELAARELELARSLQKRLLPPSEHLGENSAWRPAISRRNTSRAISTTTSQLADGRLRIAVADVAGKGMAASLITATVKAVLP